MMLPPPARRSLRHGVFAHQEGAGEIDADRPVPLLERKRLDRAVGGDGRGDIDQRGEPAECRDRFASTTALALVRRRRQPGARWHGRRPR